MISTLKENKFCINCLKPGHFVKQCKSLHRCRKCQKLHHTLLHVDTEQGSQTTPVSSTPVSTNPTPTSVSSHTAAGLSSNTLLMTCLSHGSPLWSIASVKVSSTRSPHKKKEVAAIIVPRVTCDLPFHPVSFDSSHFLTQISDVLEELNRLGVDVFVEALCQGRRFGPPGSPTAFETEFGWVLAGRLDSNTPKHGTSHHASFIAGDDLLCRFWEIEENPNSEVCLSSEEQSVVQHFKETHHRNEAGRFVVPLPKKPRAKPLGESRSQAVRRFLSLERSLHSKGQFKAFSDVIEEYFPMNHAEPVPIADLDKP